MNAPVRDYLVPERTGVEEVKRMLQAHRQIAADPARSVIRRFYDTFDWRIFHAGGCLWEQVDSNKRQLFWEPFQSKQPQLKQRLTGEVSFADQLDLGPVRARIAPISSIRRLLPIVQISSRVQTLRVLNEDEKTVVRMEIEENRFEENPRNRHVLGARIRVRPIRGYPDAYRGVLRILENELELIPARTPLLLEALSAAGRTPGDYSSKLNFRLDPDRRADETTKEILLHLLNVIEANIPGVRENLDPEFLHDLRVAVRRTRSALSQIKGVFAPEIVQEYKDRFAWVGQITGPVRDLDVYLLDFPSYQRSLPEFLQPHLEPLRAFLLSHYDEAQKALAEQLASQEMQDLLNNWRAFLEAPAPEHPTAPNALRPTKWVADARIWRMYKRVLREGRAIDETSPPEDLHELRKSCKKLRYLLEFFASLYPKKEMRKLIKILKTLLDNLGRFQDLAVQADSLRRTAHTMSEEGRADPDSLLAMGVLVGGLLSRQAAARQEFAGTFATFDSPSHQRLFRSLFRTKKKGGHG